MRKTLPALLFLLLGFTAGWYLKPESDSPVAPKIKQERGSGNVNEAPKVPDPFNEWLSNQSVSQSDNVSSNQADLKRPDKIIDPKLKSAEISEDSAVDKFIRLLNQHDYSAAMDYFHQLEFNNPGLVPALKRALLKLLKAKLNSQEFEHFNDIAEYWLANYYRDIDVLLLLAQSNSVQAYYGEAVSLFQLGRSYAANDAERTMTKKALFDFIASKDVLLSERGEWRELQNFYELLEQAGLTKSDNLLRLAEIYLYNGYDQEGRRLAEKLLLDPRYAKQAESLLSKIDKGETASVSPGVIKRQNVPLRKMGAHYLAELTLPENNKLRLILDTGATLTTISQSALDVLSAATDYKILPSRFFNTANGVVRGEVVLIDAIYIGDFLLRDVEMAVLPISGDSEVHGLLGMNILSQFKFQLNQTTSELVLEQH